MTIWAASPTRVDDETVRFEGRAMASPLSLQVVGTAERDAARAWRAVVDTFAESDALMSRFRADSEITALNRASIAGASCRVSRRLAVAVHAADRAHRLTRGRFDPRVVGLLDGWGYRGTPLGAAAQAGGVGSAERIVVRTDRATLRLPHPVDLGGIGKGLALRWARDRLDQAAVGRYLLDAGGDLVARGSAPDGGPWVIGIEDPRGADGPRAALTVETGAVATSSIRRHHWVDRGGRERHHLVDPATAAPADGGLRAVTVAAADPAWAEVWSKALFVAGRDAIAILARGRGLAAWWVADDGSLEMTPAARARTVWVAGEA